LALVLISPKTRNRNKIIESRITRNILNNTAAGILVQGAQSEIIENVAALQNVRIDTKSTVRKNSF
jgi:hypothetical protein